MTNGTTYIMLHMCYTDYIQWRDSCPICLSVWSFQRGIANIDHTQLLNEKIGFFFIIIATET